MFETHKNGKRWVTLNPGEHFVTKEDMVMTTLLGSCVSACLFDPVNKVCGMNHFLLSNKRYSRDLPIFRSEAGRYGVHAMELLINEMLAKGAQKKYLHAKAFGGGNLLTPNNHDNFFCVGAVNSAFIQDFLKLENIPLDAHSLGGKIGRVLRFITKDFSVLVRKIEKTQQKTILQKEHVYWKKTIKEHKKEESEVSLW